MTQQKSRSRKKCVSRKKLNQINYNLWLIKVISYIGSQMKVNEMKWKHNIQFLNFFFQKTEQSQDWKLFRRPSQLRWGASNSLIVGEGEEEGERTSAFWACLPIVWIPLDSFLIFLILLESFWFFWNLLESFGIFWNLLESFGIFEQLGRPRTWEFLRVT